jgi:ABC-type lipoprotein release transport system permease subunit
MLLYLAWRNLWRNKRRTLITTSALTLGVLAVVFIDSYRESMFGEMVGRITSGLVGHLQVHGKGYQSSPEIGTLVRDPKRVEATLARALPGAQTVRRVLGYGLAAVGESSTAALVIGIEPAREGGSDALLSVEQGRALGEAPKKEAVLGRDLARQLEATIGSELVMVGQAADGSVANDRFTVAGIADAGNSELNSNAIFVHLADAQDFFGLGEAVHQIIVRLPAGAADEELTAPLAALRGSLDLTALEVLSWSQILPELKATIEQKRQSQHFIDLIVILIVGLGVLNAMTMSTFERTREFGVMAALGTRRRRMLALIVTEALLEGLLGCAVGLALAVALLYGMGTIELAGFSQQDMLGVRVPSAVRLRLEWSAVKSAVSTSLLTVLLGGLWPAIRASRLEPVEAMRYA